MSMTDKDFRERLAEQHATMTAKVSTCEANMEAVARSVRNTIRWGVGLIVMVMLALFGYVVADLASHEALDAHPEAKANMARVEARIAGQEKTTDRIAQVVESNNDMLMQIQGANGSRDR